MNGFLRATSLGVAILGSLAGAASAAPGDRCLVRLRVVEVTQAEILGRGQFRHVPAPDLLLHPLHVADPRRAACEKLTAASELRLPAAADQLPDLEGITAGETFVAEVWSPAPAHEPATLGPDRQNVLRLVDPQPVHNPLYLGFAVIPPPMPVARPDVDRTPGWARGTPETIPNTDSPWYR